jgi:hypothetical protein
MDQGLLVVEMVARVLPHLLVEQLLLTLAVAVDQYIPALIYETVLEALVVVVMVVQALVL